MKIGDFVISIGITLVILFISLALSRRQTPLEIHTTQSGELTLTHATPKVMLGPDTLARVEVNVTGGLLPDSATLFVYLRPADSPADTAFKRAPMLTITGEGLNYRRDLAGNRIGRNFEYFIRLVAPKDSTLADTVLATIPVEHAANPKSLLSVRFEGTAPANLLYPHIVFMFAAFCLMVVAVLSSLSYPKDPGALTRAGRMSVLVVLFLLIGVFGIGTKIELAMYGKSWSGIPVGGNLTDTASVILMLYWSVVVLIFRKQIISVESSEELITKRVQLLLIIGVALAVICYLIPHGAGRI